MDLGGLRRGHRRGGDRRRPPLPPRGRGRGVPGHAGAGARQGAARRRGQCRAGPRRVPQLPAPGRPGGRGLLAQRAAPAAGWLDAWLARAPDDAARGWTAEELATHIRDEYSTYTWLLEPMLERVGFDIVEREHSPS